ncbi:mitochondrial carrier domain-containing protein [Aspergillus stella-maris]|uniref:mitochondrial carrier domain-containing protein n=1 Tax=Aspergillus stella-maris TaxID=1810926 RepID=UPI003CCDCAED
MLAQERHPSDVKKKEVSLSNLLLGASLNMFEVTPLGQPLEAIKTTMAAHRNDSFGAAMKRVWARGGSLGFYQDLIPWAWIEASSKGAVLLFVASEAEYHIKCLGGASDVLTGIGGGMVGGVAQAYVTVGFCTAMKTAEITRSKLASAGEKPPSTLHMFRNIYRAEGVRGKNKGVNAVAIRQITNWGSRFGFSRLAEDFIRRSAGKERDQKLSALEKIVASSIGGGLSAWNQPVEVIRVELQSMKKDPGRPVNMNIASTARYIYRENGIRGLYRGATPRIGLGIWQTVCMVALGDMAKDAVERVTGERAAGH